MAYWQGVVTGVAVTVAAVALGAAARPAGTIDAQRINIRDADGTLRLVIAGRDAYPGSFLKGREIARPDRRTYAGLLFMNDEGTENGGLIWNGKKGPDGIDAGASLTFDRYENDQTLQLLQEDGGKTHRAALIVSDRPNGPLDWAALERGEKAPVPGRDYGATRMYVGRTADATSTVRLNDAAGKPRLRMRVEADGTAAIEFLDASGKIVRTLRPDG